MISEKVVKFKVFCSFIDFLSRIQVIKQASYCNDLYFINLPQFLLSLWYYTYSSSMFSSQKLWRHSLNSSSFSWWRAFLLLGDLAPHINVLWMSQKLFLFQQILQQYPTINHVHITLLLSWNHCFLQQSKIDQHITSQTSICQHFGKNPEKCKLWGKKWTSTHAYFFFSFNVLLLSQRIQKCNKKGKMPKLCSLWYAPHARTLQS